MNITVSDMIYLAIYMANRSQSVWEREVSQSIFKRYVSQIEYILILPCNSGIGLQLKYRLQYTRSAVNS